MGRIIIFFSDLNKPAQQAICREVTKELIDRGEVEPQRKGESDVKFERRLEEEMDIYLKYHRSDNVFYL